MKPDSDLPKYRDQSTMVSFERLSLMIEYNQIGSLTSLGRKILVREHEAMLRTRSNSIRRESCIGIYKQRGSASKVDLLKSTIEFNQSRQSDISSGQVSAIPTPRRIKSRNNFVTVLRVRRN